MGPTCSFDARNYEKTTRYFITVVSDNLGTEPKYEHDVAARVIGTHAGSLQADQEPQSEHRFYLPQPKLVIFFINMVHYFTDGIKAVPIAAATEAMKSTTWPGKWSNRGPLNEPTKYCGKTCDDIL